MLEKSIEKLTNAQLKARKGMCIGYTIVYLAAILLLLFLHFYKSSSKQLFPEMIFLGFGVLPIFYGFIINKEIERRKTKTME